MNFIDPSGFVSSCEINYLSKVKVLLGGGKKICRGLFGGGSQNPMKNRAINAYQNRCVNAVNSTQRGLTSAKKLGEVKASCDKGFCPDPSFGVSFGIAGGLSFELSGKINNNKETSFEFNPIDLNIIFPSDDNNDNEAGAPDPRFPPPNPKPAPPFTPASPDHRF